MDRTAIRAYYNNRTGDMTVKKASPSTFYDTTPGSPYMEKSVARLGVFMDKRPIEIVPVDAVSFLTSNPDILIPRQFYALLNYYTTLAHGEMA